MKKYKVIFVLFIIFCIFTSCGGNGNGPKAGSIEKFKAALEKDGFDVQNGKLLPLSIPDLFCEKILPSCYGNNNDTPYMVYVLPPAPDQDPQVQNAFPWTYRMRPDEAIVFVGYTPPPATYFSYCTYLAGRYFGDSSHFSRIYASLGDTINNFTIKTKKNPLDTKDDPFNKLVIIISTADKGIEARIRAAAQSAGYLPEIINTEVIPSELLRMGLGAKDDELTFLHRIAFFKNQEDKDRYMKSEPVIIDGKLIQPPYEPNERGWVLRLTPKKGSEPVLDPYPVPSLRVRGTGETQEFQYIKSLNELRTAILDKYSTMKATEIESYVWLTEGYDAIQRGIDVLGETRDTIYLRTTTFELAEGEFAIVYGVIHGLTGKAVYSNINIYTEDPVQDLLPYQLPTNFGFMSANSEKTVESKEGLRGSAAPYIAGHPDAGILYAWKVARNCNGEAYCLQVPPDFTPCSRFTYRKLFAAFRAYVEPTTLVGPTASEILYDRVIHFSPK